MKLNWLLSLKRILLRFVWLGLVALVLSILTSGSSPRQASAQSPLPTHNAKIGPGVVEAIQTEGQASVMIALVESPSLRSRPIDLPRVRREVARAQADVLSVLNAADYRGKPRYQAVPALAGMLLTEAGLNKLAAHPNVVKVDLDKGGSGSLASSVPLVGADRWHAGGVIGEGVVVAILDSGLDTDHDDLGDDLIHQECFLDDDGAIDGNGLCPNGNDRQSGPGAAEDNQNQGHGSHVTGIITSKGTKSAVGVAPGADIVAIKVLDTTNSFYWFSEIVAALDYIINNRPDVKIINMSLSTFATFPGDCDNSAAFTIAGATAINTLRANGVTTFAASGNNGSGTEMGAPACISNVISVGATDNNDNVAAFTQSNASTDIMAPGVSIVSDYLANGVNTLSGTSMASPHAAGCAALLIASGEATSPDEIEARLKSSPIQVTDSTNGLSFPRITCGPTPPAGVNIAGPTEGAGSANHSFLATTTPLTTTQPLTYTWQATGQASKIQTGGLSNSLDFNWNTSGPQVITVTAENMAGWVTGTHIIAISPVSPTGVIIAGPMTGINGIAYPFTATINPITATWPFTYVWQATGQAPITNTGTTSNSVTFDWRASGPQTITVTAQNAGDSVVDTHVITLSSNVYLPILLK